MLTESSAFSLLSNVISKIGSQPVYTNVSMRKQCIKWSLPGRKHSCFLPVGKEFLDRFLTYTVRF